MLAELKISNFRIFDDEVIVRFRPITILIGRNSSGKSTIVKFLLMLQQSAAPGQSRFLAPEGDKVGLGVFPELKNSLTKKRRLSFTLSAEQSPSQLPINDDGPLTWRSRHHTIMQNNTMLYRLNAHVNYGRSNRRGMSKYTLTTALPGRTLETFSRDIADETSLFDFPSLDFDGQSRSEGTNGADRSSATTPSDLQRFQEWMLKQVERIQIVDTFRKECSAIRHLLPVRAEAQRVIVAASPPSEYVGQKGEYALPHLQQLIEKRDDGYDFIRPHLRNVAGIQTVEFKTSAAYVSQAYAQNQTTGAEVLVADYGFGVGQCLPIMVQGAIMPPHTTLMVEQPEAQLHPTAQLELGGFFADLWTKRKVASIIETHSDNILLRVRRLIASGKFPHDDVSVAYFTFDETNHNMPIVKNLDINEDGSMQPGLPMEFFGADIFEAMEMGARL